MTVLAARMAFAARCAAGLLGSLLRNFSIPATKVSLRRLGIATMSLYPLVRGETIKETEPDAAPCLYDKARWYQLLRPAGALPALR
jgi:hypothetical protein